MSRTWQRAGTGRNGSSLSPPTFPSRSSWMASGWPESGRLEAIHHGAACRCRRHGEDLRRHGSADGPRGPDRVRGIRRFPRRRMDRVAHQHGASAHPDPQRHSRAGCLVRRQLCRPLELQRRLLQRRRILHKGVSPADRGRAALFPCRGPSLRPRVSLLQGRLRGMRAFHCDRVAGAVVGVVHGCRRGRARQGRPGEDKAAPDAR